eukprot:CAMPEP_0204905154 /NCGR_PEP_ID=MMETSP1397-20131031/5270_1 /ASSEMBLY_ACC=CAM_ASM_000891 /TAXON_ID=49980 /ORGANISM="Climacostomum Climacostomum virens, Strain Stock W-24" /LENGTH=980 /DNA_ID=CAMNT_0052074023 /DNA_START=1088 /DNA_END=4030 /DNA_ORIENTATION=+
MSGFLFREELIPRPQELVTINYFQDAGTYDEVIPWTQSFCLPSHILLASVDDNALTLQQFWVGLPNIIEKDEEIEKLQAAPRVCLKFPGAILRQLEFKYVEGLCYIFLGTKALTVHLLVLDPSKPLAQLPDYYDEGNFLRALSSLQLSEEVGRPACFTAQLIHSKLSTSSEFLIGLESNSFIKASYPIEDFELKLSNPRILVMRPPKSLVKAFSSLFKSADANDAIVSIAEVSSYVITVNSSGILRVWSSAEKMRVLAEAVVAERPSIFKVVSRAKGTSVLTAVALESSGSQSISLFSFSTHGIELLSVVSPPYSYQYFDFDLNDSTMAVVWTSESKHQIACFSVNEACNSQVLAAELEGYTNEDMRILGVTCTNGFAAVIRARFLGLLRKPITQLEGHSWLAELVRSKYETCVDSADIEIIKQLRIEVQGFDGSWLGGSLALVRLWRPPLDSNELIEDYLERVRRTDLPYHIGMLMTETMNHQFLFNFAAMMNDMQLFLGNSQLVKLDESVSVWPNSIMHLLSQGLLSLSYSLTELALDMLILGQLTVDKSELFLDGPLIHLQELSATAESCLAIQRGLSCSPAACNSAPAITMILAERSAALIGFPDYIDVQNFTEWAESTLSSIFHHLKLLMPSRNNCATPTLLELLSTIGQTEAVNRVIQTLPPCYAGIEFESALCNRSGIERVSVLADATGEGGLHEFMTGRWWKLTSPPTDLHRGDLALKFLSLVGGADSVPREVALEAAQMLAYVAQAYSENEGMICDIYHNYIKLGSLSYAFALLSIMEYPEKHIASLVQALFLTGKLQELPLAQTYLRSLVIDTVRELAAKEQFSIDLPLQCARFAKEAWDMFGNRLKSTRPFLGFHDLLFSLELQTGQFAAAAAAMYSYAHKIEQAINVEGYIDKAEEFCKKLHKHALLCASTSLHASQESVFITESFKGRSSLKRTAEGKSLEPIGSEADREFVTREGLQQKLAKLLRT